MHRYDLFLSHNSADKAWTERLATEVEADRSGPALTVFFDKWDILPGADVPRELEEALQASRYVGLVLSPAALASDWVSLERSTAMYRDPRSRSRHLIPLLRRDCVIPDMLARLKYLDFRREVDFHTSLGELIALLRGRPLTRGSSRSVHDAHLREDAALLAQHRKAFERRAFISPCQLELSTRELLEAVDDTIAAMNTGSLYSRSGKLLSTFAPWNEYRLPQFKTAFSRVMQRLDDLRRMVVGTDEEYGDKTSLHPFYIRRVFATAHNEDPILRRAMESKAWHVMDAIDELRNDILSELNSLLALSHLEPFNFIPLSSTLRDKQLDPQEVKRLWAQPPPIVDMRNGDEPPNSVDSNT